MTTRFQKLPAWVLKAFKYPPRVIYALGLGPLIGGWIMLLTTRGRKSGKPRTTPLQYEWLDGELYVGSMRAESAAWYRNLLADPHVQVRVGRLRGQALAEPVREVQRGVAFLQERLCRHPRMIAAMLRADGMSDIHDPLQLAVYTSKIALVVFHLESM
jgi:deazaflavin-dependent oxidoreductase (nitroreductase family)